MCMKFKRLISVLLCAVLILGCGVSNVEASSKYAKKSVSLLMEILEIDPVTNPARDNWLTREIAKQVRKQDPTKLTQSDFNTITEISIDNKDIPEIPKEIGNLFNLKSVDIRNCDLKELPMELFNLISLEKIYFNYTKITKIPQEIGNLKNLKELSFSHNEITKLPIQLFDLPKLESLYCDNNKINEIPPEIGKSISLKDFYIRNNLITEIPDEIAGCKSLEDFQISNNQIEKIPAAIGDINTLYSIDMSNNKLQSIPSEIGKIERLRTLLLSNNQIAQIPKEIDTNKIYLNAENQIINLPIKKVKKYEEFSIKNPISYMKPVSPVAVSINFGGQYSLDTNRITWNAGNITNKREFKFNLDLDRRGYRKFSGTVYQPITFDETESNTKSVHFPNDFNDKHLKLNETIKVPVVASGSSVYYAMDTSISYDTTKLKYTGYEIQNTFKDCYASSKDNLLRFIIASKGKDNPINTDDQYIIYLNFQAIGKGKADIQVSSGTFADLDKEEVLEDKELGKITLTIEDTPGDINRDGKFNLVDLAIDAYYYGVSAEETDKTKYDADIIPDGNIDDLDLQEITNMIINGETK